MGQDLSLSGVSIKPISSVFVVSLPFLTSSCAFSSFFGSPPFSKVFRLSLRAFTTSVGDLEDFPNSGNMAEVEVLVPDHTLSNHLEGMQVMRLIFSSSI